MLDKPEVFLQDRLPVSYRPLGGGLQDRLRTPGPVGRLDTPVTEEEVIDDRSAMSAAQMVENKLSRILKDASLPVSHLQMRNLLRSR